MIGGDGRLYGTTNGGGPHGFGTLFAVDPAAGTTTVIYSFTSAGQSFGELTQGSDGNLYGVRAQAPTSYGLIFRVNPQNRRDRHTAYVQPG